MIIHLSTNSLVYFFRAAFLCGFFLIALNLSSCRQNNNDSQNDKLPSADSTAFYPVHEYFLSQIKSVDSSTPTIHMVKITNGQKDSGTINIDQFNKIAQIFLENNIADISIKKYYRQSVFQDMTTSSYAFNYTSVNSSLPVQNLTILLDTTTQSVKRVFISKVKMNGDSTITEKLSWKNDNSFLINRTVQLPQKKGITEQVSVVWDDNN